MAALRGGAAWMKKYIIFCAAIIFTAETVAICTYFLTRIFSWRGMLAMIGMMAIMSFAYFAWRAIDEMYREL